MKKTYISPSVNVKEVAPMQMIAESIIMNGTYNGSSNIEVRGSRSDSEWDDEW